MGEETAIRSVTEEPTEWPDALVELYGRERMGFVRLAYLMVRDRGVAEEIVQDAFIGLHRGWDDVRNPAGYLRVSIVNGCRSWGRHNSVVRANPPDRPEPVLMEPDEMWDALGRLDERRRTAIVLRYYADMPHAEIAAILGCGTVTVRTSIHRGLQQMKREIQR